MFILLEGALTVLFAQNTDTSRTTQEILMSYKWIPVDIYDAEDGTTGFITYTETQQIDSIITDDGELETYVLTYYLSNTPDTVFDNNKVGKTHKGKYLILHVNEKNEISSTIILELVELSKKKMVIRNSTEWLSNFGIVNTYLAHPQ